MPRFDERPLQWTDVLGRFEEHSHQRHFRDAWALTGRLKDEGRDHWQVGSEQLARWNRGCDNLLGLMTGLGKRRDLEKQDLSTALREFIQEFEHHTERMYQMIYGEINDSENNEKLTEIFDWFNLNQYQGGMCISGVLPTTERTPRQLISPLALVLGSGQGRHLPVFPQETGQLQLL